MFVEVVWMSLCGLCSLMLCLGLFVMWWLTDGGGRQLDTSVAPLVKGHLSSPSFGSGHLRRKEWKAQRAQSQKRAVTLKHPLHICHCQELSASVDAWATQTNRWSTLRHGFWHCQRTRRKNIFVILLKTWLTQNPFQFAATFSDTALVLFPTIPCGNGNAANCTNCLKQGQQNDLTVCLDAKNW